VSRIGKKPVPVVSGVKVQSLKQATGTRVSVEGPKGKLVSDFRPEVSIEVQGAEVVVTRTGDEPFHRAYHGTTRALIANMVRGVSEGFEKRLQIVGVGYNVKVQGQKLVLQIGFSHPVEVTIPSGVKVETPSTTSFVVRGADKAQVGEFAARVRKIRPPEPYKGKGIRYEEEHVIRKAGKAFGSGE
jgi:large subunit ribosomal protein L6